VLFFFSVPWARHISPHSAPFLPSSLFSFSKHVFDVWKVIACIYFSKVRVSNPIWSLIVKGLIAASLLPSLRCTNKLSLNPNQGNNDSFLEFANKVNKQLK
jgi:hypothetical protein